MFNYDGRGSIRIGSLKIRASRFPWQAGADWGGLKASAPLNAPKKGKTSSPRFGGGWSVKFGFAIGGSTLALDLLFGSVFFSIETDKDRAALAELRAVYERQRAARAPSPEPF